MIPRIPRFVYAIASAILFADAAPIDALVINNGFAPPNPANVIDAANSVPHDDLRVQNVGCNANFIDPCPSPGAPTVVDIVDGGSVGAASYPVYLMVHESSAAVISGGGVYGTIDALDNSSVTISGGTLSLYYLLAHDAASITLSGGSLTNLTNVSHPLPLYTETGGSITILGTNFEVNGIPAGYGNVPTQSGVLTGTLASGGEINVRFYTNGYQSGGYSGTITLAPVPEPQTGLFLVAGLIGLAALRREM